MNLNTDGSATLVGCHIQLDYADRLLIATLLPIGVVLLACAVVLSRYVLLAGGFTSIPLSPRRRRAIHRLLFIPAVPRWVIRRAKEHMARVRRAADAGTPVERDESGAAKGGATTASLAAAAVAEVTAEQEAERRRGAGSDRRPPKGAGAVIVSDLGSRSSSISVDGASAPVSRWQALTEGDPMAISEAGTPSEGSRERQRSDSSPTPRIDADTEQLVRRLFLRMILDRCMDVCVTIYIFVSFLVFPGSAFHASAHVGWILAHRPPLPQRATRC